MQKKIIIVVCAVLALACLGLIFWATMSGSDPQASSSTPGSTPTQTQPTGSTGCGHDFEEIEVVDATCQTEGSRTIRCRVCNERIVDTLDALGHSFTNYISNEDAGCLEDGTKTAQCDRCEETETVTDTGSATGHQYAETVVAPTCTEQGYTQRVCPCGDEVIGAYVAALGHKITTSVVSPTCTREGFTRHTCSTCAYTYKTNTVAAFGHSYGGWTVVDPGTCETNGLQRHSCVTCGHSEDQIIASNGHEFAPWEAMEEPIAEDVYPEQSICSACGGTYTRVDLSNTSGAQAEALAEQLAQLPNVYRVELTKADGTSNYSVADVKHLVAAAPKAVFNYSFTLFGKTIHAAADKVEFVNVSIGDAGAAQIRDALDILTHCTYFKLDSCGISNEVMASIRDDYPATKVVWRIFIGHKSWLTDTDTLRALYLITNSNCGPLKYLTDVKYMDLGHNESMGDLSFIAYMPNLEIAILSGSPITDLTPLANCKKLVFLELAWCGHLKDISPLAQCDSLIYLNVGHTQVRDFSALYGMDLQMLSYVNSGNRVGFTAADWAELQTKFPNCWITYDPLYDNNATPYGVGWRYKENWGGYTEIYRKVRDVFDYDYIDSLIQGGAT